LGCQSIQLIRRFTYMKKAMWNVYLTGLAVLLTVTSFLSTLGAIDIVDAISEALR
jgi:hypothetical protein